MERTCVQNGETFFSQQQNRKEQQAVRQGCKTDKQINRQEATQPGRRLKQRGRRQHRQTGDNTDSQINRQTGRRQHRQSDKQADRQEATHTGRRQHRQTGCNTDRQINRQTGRRQHRQADKQTDR